MDNNWCLTGQPTCNISVGVVIIITVAEVNDFIATLPWLACLHHCWFLWANGLKDLKPLLEWPGGMEDQRIQWHTHGRFQQGSCTGHSSLNVFQQGSWVGHSSLIVATVALLWFHEWIVQWTDVLKNLESLVWNPGAFLGGAEANGIGNGLGGGGQAKLALALVGRATTIEVGEGIQGSEGDLQVMSV